FPAPPPPWALPPGLGGRVGAGEEQPRGGVGARQEARPDEPRRREDRGALRDARGSTLVDRHGARESKGVVTDDAGREQLAAERAAEVEQLAQPGVLELDLGEPRRGSLQGGHPGTAGLD